jgi:hypothetical protein
MSSELVNEFLELALEKERLEERTEAIDARMKVLEEEILGHWADAGTQSVKQSGRTLFIRHDFYCSKKRGVFTQKICDLLREHGLERMVSEGYNAQSLKAVVKEWASDEGPGVPEDLAAVLNYDTVPRLIVRRS